MFQFRRFPSYDYFIHRMMHKLHLCGFPHSEIHGSMSAFDSPWLFADCCVLHRLPVPRHSPCALCSLTILLNLWFSCFNSTIISIVVVTLKLIITSILLHFSLFSFQGALPIFTLSSVWWAQVDSNHRPHAYQACALTT